jgi:peptidoglycan hydrolase CwlO-like protein
MTESSISKWKKPQCQEIPQTTHNSVLNDDQQLTQYQISRKKAEHELCALEKLKRPSEEERERMGRLEREIYHLDSDIAGLKRKIRRKY